MECGDYSKGIARIKCTNEDCENEYFRPFSCQEFYFCPSCSQKRTLLFGEYMNNEMLLRLAHCSVTFTMPKSLRVFLKNDKNLFSDISMLIFSMIKDFYEEATGCTILTGLSLAYHSFGDFLRSNAHFHGILLQGGFDSKGNFYKK